PRGVVGVIAPGNFPIAGLYRSVFPALLLGNAVVLKPSEHSPRSSAWFVRQLQAELPPHVLELIQGDGQVGAALVAADIDACVFTGSSRVGAEVERSCQQRGIAVSAEQGGNDAAIVLGDAELPRTVAGITHWALQNAGQACGAIEVVYADSRIAGPLAERLADAFRRLQAPTEPGLSGTLAPLAHEGQLRAVLAQLEDAIAKGAEVLCGGGHRGLFMEPTVLANCTDDMLVVSEETFGPLLPIVAVDGPADAIRRVNRGRYGLTASLWTADTARAEVLARDLDVGVVTVNNHAFTGAIADLPWSGRRDSGHGIANSAWSLLTFARPKTVVVDRSHGVEPFWAPFDDDLVELGHLLADAQRGRIARAFRIPLLLQRRAARVKAFFGIG
ncbi:MAG TPA: aldehyde dehydrogenase family protein, partial [Polyangiaceae bacterium]|nr:aldehyde dehydrogenase family protein [Polyangiaceae bacterium]